LTLFSRSIRVKDHRLRAVACRFRHEIGAVLAHQARGMVDQVALLRPRSQVDGGIAHGVPFLRIHV
jgi:hypothetical protein